MTALEQEEDRFGILRDDIGAPDIIVLPVKTQFTDAGVLPAAIAVGPKPASAGRQHRNPSITRGCRIRHICLKPVTKPNEWSERSVAGRGSRFHVRLECFKTIGNEAATLRRDLLEAPSMVLVEIISQHFGFVWPWCWRAVSRHVCQVDTPHHQFDVRRKCIGAAAPVPIHVAIVTVRRHWPGTVAIVIDEA